MPVLWLQFGDRATPTDGPSKSVSPPVVKVQSSVEDRVKLGVVLFIVAIGVVLFLTFWLMVINSNAWEGFWRGFWEGFNH